MSPFATNRRVLVIDDNRAIHDDFRKILTSWGQAGELSGERAGLFDDEPSEERTTAAVPFEVDCADQGRAGFEMACAALKNGTPYSLAFVDMRMPPGWDGVETIQHLWEADPELQVIVCTAYSDHPWEKVIHDLGRNDKLLVLRKPFDVVEAWQLANCLSHKWSSHRQARLQMDELEGVVRERTSELAAARDGALAAVRAKANFLATMSHEIRTPLTGILGMTDLIIETPLDATQKDYAITLKSSAHALLTIVNDVLDYSRIEAGRMSLERIAYRPRVVVEDVARLFSAVARGNGIELSVVVESTVPESVLGDPARLRQILTNLGGNAVKFTRAGSVSIGVAAPRPGFLRFSVTDTGIGIGADGRAKLFEAFSQADDSTSRRFGGTGLGLAICRRFTELMGGEIGVESEPGAGSTFWFEIPAVEAAAGIAPEPAEHRSDLNALRGRILLAEDNAVNRKVLGTVLRGFGLEVDFAEDGLQAVEMCGRRHYDLVLMDCQMPGMDGYQATEQIRRLDSAVRATPVVALTASALPGDREVCLRAGMNDYVPKPIERGELYRVVRQWLGATGAIQ